MSASLPGTLQRVQDAESRYRKESVSMVIRLRMAWRLLAGLTQLCSGQSV